MSTYYKYAEQSADSQVNWADVSKNVSEMLSAEVKIREEKKTAYEEAFQKLNNTLANPIQGQWQDGNKFTNDAAHDLSQQNLMNYRLFKSGQMNERDYTLGRQNLQNGTNTVFNLRTAFDAAHKDRVDGLLSGKYQAATGANMKQVEGFKNFANAKVIIDPYTSQVSLGIMAKNPTTGVMELTNNNMPANVLMGMIGTPIPSWDADGSINAIVEKMGKNEEVIYNAANKTRAGTITKLLGLGALEGEYAKKDKDGKPLYPQLQDSIDNINKGINDTIDSFFSIPNNITSVLTQNTKNYNQDSYTFDRDVAAKDKTKILRRLDETTGLPALDPTAPYYKEQVQEARDYVRGQMLSKMDAKRDMTTTATTPYGPQRQQWQDEAARGDAEKLAGAGAWNQLYTGKTAAEKQAAADILLGTPQAQQQGLIGIDVSTKGQVKLVYDNSKKNRTISMLDSDGRPINLGDFAAKGVELHGIVDRKKAMGAGGGGKGYGNLSDWTGIKAARAGEAPEAPKAKPIPVDLFGIKSPKSAKLLQSILPTGFKVKDTGAYFGNTVEVTAPNGEVYEYNADEPQAARNAEKLLLEKFIKDNSGGGMSGGKVR